MFKDVKVHFVAGSIKFAARRTKIWTEKIHVNGGEVVDLHDKATHLVAEDPEAVPEELLDKKIVSVKWIEACLARHEQLPVTDYAIDINKGVKRKRDPEEDGQEIEEGGPLYHYKLWLGFWNPAFNEMKNTTELVLQARYDIKDSRNENIVARLLELYKYECAVMREHDNDHGIETESGINHKALQYARAASIVRACAYKIDGAVAEHELPFVASNARIINEIAKTGTSEELEAFRSGDLVHDSKGRPRPETLGANMRLSFFKLPGVGVESAKAWWEKGFRSYKEVEEHAKEYEFETMNGKRLVTKYQLFSLKHRKDLLEHCPPSDISEMKDAVSDTLRAITGSDWEVWLVGGERRNKASHDADFVVSHPTSPVTGAVQQLVDILISQGRMVSPAEGMCLVQKGRAKDSSAASQQDFSHKEDANNLLADRHDRVVGFYITKKGKYRRMDVIMPTYDEMPFCLISWTGSKQYSRFMRTHASNRGMHLNAHRLAVEHNHGWLDIPRDSPPLGRDGKPFWPKGWSNYRDVKSEKDIFELLEIPWREAWQRNCQ